MKKSIVSMDSNDIIDSIIFWGYLDRGALDRYLQIYTNLDGTLEDLESQMEDCEIDKFDINSWFFFTIEGIFHIYKEQLLKYLNDENYDKNDKEADNDLIINYLEELSDNFSPFINYLDSWFNNIFDEFSFNIEEDIETLRQLKL